MVTAKMILNKKSSASLLSLLQENNTCDAYLSGYSWALFIIIDFVYNLPQFVNRI